eukprot:TRINITY_DN6954_c1_g1_i1.p1 TRINITY_DN6954_c1_g1~~TRINITY_DN6954_c1_g1_i1.p1  ORF type:complete len:173 (-),score=31.21 TRINITY_DN6954_c1_g1_i1:75-593(-)
MIASSGVWDVVTDIYRTKFASQDQAFLQICKSCLPKLIFPTILQNETHHEWNLAVSSLVEMKDANSPFSKLECLEAMNTSISKTQPLVGGDEIADALTYVLMKAGHPHIISDCKLLIDTLDCFLEDFDSYYIHLFSELCFNFKQITDYILANQPEEPDLLFVSVDEDALFRH